MFDRAFLGDRTVRPGERPVWIDLAAAFAQYGDPTRFPTLLDLSSRVPGTLLSWQKTKTGSWVAWVQMRVHRDPVPAYDRQIRTVTTAVPTEARTERLEG